MFKTLITGRTETATENGVGQAASCRQDTQGGSHSPMVSLMAPDQWCVFCTPSLAIFTHAVMKWIQIWRIWRPQSRWDKFGVNLFDNSLVAHARWALPNFARYNVHAEKLFRWSGKGFRDFFSKFILETIHHISLESPQFCRR